MFVSFPKAQYLSNKKNIDKAIKRVLISGNYILNKESKKGIYIIHGFSSNTYEIRDIAKYLGKHGFFVVAKRGLSLLCRS